MDIRTELRDGDPKAIADLHRRVYAAEYGLGNEFVESVARGIGRARADGWPESGGGVWLVDGRDGLAGALALTEEGAGLGRVRWFVLAAELRGRGLGREMLAALLVTAREAGLERLELMTFSELTAAAHLYLEAGFELRSERALHEWGRPLRYQSYELSLAMRTGSEPSP